MKKGQQTVIFLMRHGQTNRGYFPLQGVDDQRILSPEGIEAIERVGQYLTQFAPVAIWSSPMKRCTQTAEIFNQACSKKVGVTIKPELMEIYSPQSFYGAGKRGEGIVAQAVAQFPGQQIILVTHQYVISKTIEDLKLEELYPTFPCGMGEGYRLVFASDVCVQGTKITPASHELSGH